MKVVQHLANGATRDVTEYITWSDAPLTAADTDITVYFSHVLYNDDAEVLDPPQTVVNLTVLSADDMTAYMDVAEAIDALGEVTVEDGERIAAIRTAYDALPVNLQEMVLNYPALTRAEEEYSLLYAAEVENAEKLQRLIEAMGEIDPESADELEEAFRLYGELSDVGRAMVASYDTLLQKQAEYEALLASMDAGAANVMQLISAIGEISKDSGDAIWEARGAYDALSEESKALVTNYALLQRAEGDYAKLLQEIGEAVRLATELIEAIGTVTLDREDEILRAREVYDALDESVREKVGNYGKLVAAEEALAILKEQLAALGEVTLQADAIVARLALIAETPEEIGYANAGQAAPLVQQLLDLISAQSEEDRELLSGYASLADGYRIAIEGCVHLDPAANISADGLAWYQQLRIETLSSAKDADYAQFKSLISPKRAIKVYRATVMDLLTGEPAADHGKLKLSWTIPVPNYNESSYSSIGVMHIDASAEAVNLESAYAGGTKFLTFSTVGDGVFGVVGVKAQMSASDSVESSGSVLDELIGDQSGSTSQAGNGSGSVTQTVGQSSVIAYGNQPVQSGEWTYAETVIEPIRIPQLTDAQLNLYTALSEGVEAATNSVFAHALSQEEFEQVEEYYRLSNPLAVLIDFVYEGDQGLVSIDYRLPEEEHLAVIDNWHDQIERIVQYCLVPGDAEATAAQLYQHVAANTILQLPEWLPEETDADLSAQFYPSAWYAGMHGAAAKGDAAVFYGYLLLQVGIECMQVREVIPETEDSGAEEPHIWVIQKINGAYSHADPEMDMYDAALPDAERDTLAHFGMSDATRAIDLALENGVEPVVPILAENDAGTEDGLNAETPDAVPECPDDLTGYAMEETVTIISGDEG